MSMNNTLQNAFYAALRNRFKTLFNRYKVNVLADGGTVRNDSFTQAYMKFCQNQRTYNSIREAIFPEAGIKTRTSGVNQFVTKAYGLPAKDSTSINSEQTTQTNHPYLGGFIAQNERYCLKNTNGASTFLTHNLISFGASDSWSITTVFKCDGNINQSQDLWGKLAGGTFKIATATLANSSIYFVSKNNVVSQTASTSSSFYGKNTIITLVALGDGSLDYYKNGVLIEHFPALVNRTSIDIDRLMSGRDGQLSGSIKGHVVRAQALTPTEVLNEYNFLKPWFPEMESVVIGTQTWTTSNCEMACTPMGNVIAEMQTAANVEKITNVADREFSSDTGYWSKSASGVTIANNVCTFSLGGSGSAYIYKNAGVLNNNKYIKITYTISRYVSGALRYDKSPLLVNLPTSLGSNSVYIYNNAGDGIGFSVTNNSDFDLDSISIQEIGWSGSQELYDGIYAQTSGTVEQKTYAAVKAAAMWCHYNNSVDNGAIYGKLYNWFAVKLLQMDIDYYNTANPTTPWGWRVPTQADFTTLSTYLGGDAISGGKLKMTGTTYWSSPNTGADNSSGFSALGASYRSNTGIFGVLNNDTYFRLFDNSFVKYLTKDSSNIFYTDYGNILGFSLRLIKA